ncbi:MAG: hypothetical protein M0D55_07150 [Elusimicrobiota bacterium]|nr:MAG: hypothetical protein M0D55_07150 [Elusimicrobiota bacterium]
MGEMMGKMMEKMGTPPPKQLYPTLMELPTLSPERRLQMEGSAHDRVKAGAALMSGGFERLAAVAATDDYAGQQEAMAQVREGMDQFESGLAVRQALAVGMAPRFVALSWFKSEMNLGPQAASEEQRTILGVTPFHLFSMLLLIAFALAMIAMYFFKMRRAAALFGRLDEEKNPPPGAAPPLAGASGPSAPGAPKSPGTPAKAAPDGKTAKAEDKPSIPPENRRRTRPRRGECSCRSEIPKNAAGRVAGRSGEAG